MAMPNREAIETFMSITGASELVAIQKLEEHAGNLNEAVDAHFSEGDRNITHETSEAVPEDDLMDIDDPVQVDTHLPPFSLLPSARSMNPFSLFNPSLIRSIFGGGTDPTSTAPFVSHPRELREIPIEVKDGNGQSGHSGLSPSIQDVTGSADEHSPGIEGIVTIDEEDEEIPTARVAPWNEGNDHIFGGYSHAMHSRPSVPGIDDLSEYEYDIEKEMIQAAIEASKRDAEMGYPSQTYQMPQQNQSHLEDAELAHAVSLSLKTAEQEKAVRELKDNVGQPEDSKSAEVKDQGKLSSSNGRLGVEGSSSHDIAAHLGEESVMRDRSRPVPSGSVEFSNEIGEIESNPPSSSLRNTITDHPQHNKNVSLLEEWGGISSLEQNEAVMLENALFGGGAQEIPYHVPYEPHQVMQNEFGDVVGRFPRQMPRPPSPSLTSQRLIREQQDDEFLASLQADRVKELKAREEAETRRLQELAAREAALEEERKKEKESLMKLAKEQDLVRQLAAKEASLPQEPSSDDENAVTLLVRMPDGSRLGRRFLKSHKLQYLFDFIDVGRAVEPGTYRLVRPYPRRGFGDGESTLTFDDLGLSSKQEALFLELI